MEEIEQTVKQRKARTKLDQCLTTYVDPADREITGDGSLAHINPQQTVHSFGAVEISSKFDSGNMSNCTKAPKGNGYHIYISGDGLPYQQQGHYRTWFYFSVTGVKKDESVTFSIRNMGNQGKLYKNGLKPVLRVAPNHQRAWKRIPSPVSWDYLQEGFTVTWTTKFEWDSSDVAYFAWTFPYSFKESLDKSLSIY